MENEQHDGRKAAMVVDIGMLVPKTHLLRKIDKVMDYDWVYERLKPYYSKRVDRPSIDPVVLIKMVLIRHLFGIPSLRQTWREIDVNVAYRWFLGYDLLERIPHLATVSYTFCKRFPTELSTKIFDHVLNKALNNRMVDMMLSSTTSEKQPLFSVMALYNPILLALRKIGNSKSQLK